jgi:alcohol dehydrogenase (NADP+)
MAKNRPGIVSYGYAAKSAKDLLSPITFQRREVGEHDVLIDIQFCGICHSDIHRARDEWGGTIFPVVPGHEIIGKVSKVGSKVMKFKAGETVGVGCYVDSCRACDACREGLENYCEKGSTVVFNSKDKYGEITKGGFSNDIVVDEDFVLRVSPKLDPAAAAPLLCAGITTYSPLRHWKVGKGQKVGIAGFGGLGHMALKFAHSFGAHTVQLTTSPGKAQDAKRLGADEVIISTDQGQMKKHAGSFDFILDVISAKHDLNALVGLLKRDGQLVLVGLPPEPPVVMVAQLIYGRKSIAGSLVGGIKETQEMLDYCAEHGIHAEIEKIPIQKVNEAFDRTIKGDVKYRFVIDMASLKKA